MNLKYYYKVHKFIKKINKNLIMIMINLEKQFFFNNFVNNVEVFIIKTSTL